MPWSQDVKATWLEEVIFLGTGTSSQVPAIHCITDKNSDCVTCTDAMKPGSKNRRFCTSAIVRGSKQGCPGTSSTILIDCGKSFYESALRYFPVYGLRNIDALLLTHAHADAMLGLDDLRSWTMNACIQTHVDVYLTRECMDTVQQTFPYLVDTSRATGGGDVGALRWHIIDPHTPFLAGPQQVPVQPLYVEHGYTHGGRVPFACLGFRIDSMSYISDCVRTSGRTHLCRRRSNSQHHIPETTMEKVVGSDLFILDGLKMNRHTSHFSIPQAITCTLDLCMRHAHRQLSPPSLTVLTDITHRLEHHSTESQIVTLLDGLAAWLHQQGWSATNAPSRWWTRIWDEQENELHERLQLTPLSSSLSIKHAHPLVPDMRVAYDGARVTISRHV